jgi:DUF2946 family protein
MLRAFALSLGLLAMTLQGLLPLCGAASAGEATPAGSVTSIILCTSHGVQTIHLDAGGNPLPANPGDKGACSLCAAFCGTGAFLAPVVVAYDAPVGRVFVPQSFETFAPPARVHVSYASRAPPRAGSLA